MSCSLFQPALGPDEESTLEYAIAVVKPPAADHSSRSAADRGEEEIVFRSFFCMPINRLVT